MIATTEKRISKLATPKPQTSAALASSLEARVATRWAVLWMSAIAVLLMIFAPQVIGLFTSDAAVIAAGVPGLRVLALTQPFWAVFFVQAGALRGTGNTRFPLLVSSVSIWAAVGLAFALIQTIGGGLISICAA